MGRTAGRDAEQTRVLILQSAAELIVQRGLAVSLDDVAGHAGISKGGVKYHFTTKDDLLCALAQHTVDDFRREVHQRAADGDTAPGRLARAYIRASIDLDTPHSVAQDRCTLTILLSTLPAVRQIWREDSAWWDEALQSDGLPTTVIDLIVAASDGAASAFFWGEPLPAQRSAGLRDRLIGLTTSGDN